MYVQGPTRTSVQSWVDTAHDLRYKDYQLVAPVASVSDESDSPTSSPAELGSLEEVETVKEMAAEMQVRGLAKWWRRAMGFSGE